MEKNWLKNYPAGVPTEINPDAYKSIADLFNDSCSKYSNGPAIANFGHQLSYQQLKEACDVFAAYLQQKLNMRKSDRIAIMLPNVLQYPVVMFGALQAGLTIVNVNPLYTAPELVHQVNDAGAETIVVLDNFAHVVEKALPQTRLKNVIVTQMGDLFPGLKRVLMNFVVKHVKKMVPEWNIPHAIAFRQLMMDAQQMKFSPVVIEGTDIAFLQYTGGTTGVAKGAVLTHRNMVANVEQVAAWVGQLLIKENEIVITALPLYHIFSLLANCLCFLRFGALNVFITNPRDIPRFVKELQRYKFTAITGVNTLFNALSNNADFAKLDFSSLKLSLGGGAAVQSVVSKRWQTITGKPLFEAYGLTETSPAVCINPMNEKARMGSIGLPIPSTDISIRDDDGKELGIGEAGELCVRGPQVMQSYWHNPEETAKVFFADGWLRTGDIAKVDAEGFVYILERKKDMILVSGFNVYPNEVESVIATHPGVLEVAVVGVPDERSGEVVKAFVVKKDPQLTVEDVLAFCRESLTGYKMPKYIEFRDSLPKTPVGKILRRELRVKEM